MNEKAKTRNRVFIEESLIGVFGVTEDGEIVEKTLYPPDPKQIASALDRQSKGEITREVSETIEKLVQRGFMIMSFSNRALADTVGSGLGIDTEVRINPLPGERLRMNLEKLAVEYGLVDDANKLHALIREVSVLKARKAIQRAQSDRGAIITQTVQLLNELDKTLNILSSKLGEWYGLHFPELSRQIDSHRSYARIVSAFGDRYDVDVGSLRDMGFSEAKAEGIVASANDSMGASFVLGDMEPIKQLALNLLSLYGYRNELEAHITRVAEEIAPNLSVVAGPVLAAKLIERAGFEAFGMGGFATSSTLLGRPDVGLLTFSEILRSRLRSARRSSTCWYLSALSLDKALDTILSSSWETRLL